MPCGRTKTLKTPILEDLSKLEMNLPLRIAQALCIHTIESIPQIDAQRSERRDDRTANADTAEQPRRIEVRRLRPEIAGVIEGIDVQHLIEANTKLRTLRVERISERSACCRILAGLWDVPVGRNREFLVSAQRLAVLNAAQRERLRHEERSGIAEHATHSRRKPEHKLDRRRADIAATETRQRCVGPHLGRVALERGAPPQRSAVELRRERFLRSRGRKRHVDARVSR